MISSVVLASLLFGATGVLGYDASRTDNVVAYWGQNSYGAAHASDTANGQKKLAFYCDDDSIDVFPMSFMNVFFGTGGQPSINLANTCNPSDQKVFDGTALPNCDFLAADIKTCQSKGKLVTMSLGGAAGSYGFTSDDQAKQFADTIWDMLLGGKGKNRPFGDAILDGVDLDIEGGSATGYAAFVTQLRTHFDSDKTKKYMITGAPQCVFPDGYLGDTISKVPFDALYVQFYNNWCGVQNFNNPNAWNFAQWDEWARTKSPNKDVKIFIGAPASPTAANAGSYVDPKTLGDIVAKTRAQYKSFGGVMYWDASQAYGNNRFDKAIKAAIKTSGGSSPAPPNAPSTPAKPTDTKPAAPKPTEPAQQPASGSCSSAKPWSASTAYTGGQTVSEGGKLWKAQWWTQNEKPGAAGGVWKEAGSCNQRRSRFFRV